MQQGQSKIPWDVHQAFPHLFFNFVIKALFIMLLKSTTNFQRKESSTDRKKNQKKPSIPPPWLLTQDLSGYPCSISKVQIGKLLLEIKTSNHRQCVSAMTGGSQWGEILFNGIIFNSKYSQSFPKAVTNYSQVPNKRAYLLNY